MKKWLIVVALIVAGTATAALPLLFVESAISFGSGLVLRQAGKQIVTTVGVAANEATWLSSMSNIAPGAAALLGIGLTQLGGSERYMLPLSSSVTVPKPDFDAGGLGTSYQTALPYNHPGIVPVVVRKGVCYLESFHSPDGKEHFAPLREYSSWEELIQVCNDIYAPVPNKVGYLSTPRYHDYSTGCEICEFRHVMHNGTSYYVKEMQLDFFDWYQYGDIYNSNIHFPAAEYSHIDGTYGYTEYIRYKFVEPMDGEKRMKMSVSTTPGAEGGGWSPDPEDPDWSAEEKARFGNQNKTLAFSGTDASGAQVRVDVAYEPGLGVKVQAITQAAPDQVRYRSAILSSSSGPSAITESVINNATVSTLYETNPSLSVTAGTSAGTGSGNVTVTFPDDYARQATLQSADASLTEIKGALTGSVALNDPVPPTSAEFTESFFSGTFDALKGWGLPAHVSECPTTSFEWNGNVYVINAHCQLVTNHFEALRLVMTAVWSVIGLAIVLKA